VLKGVPRPRVGDEYRLHRRLEGDEYHSRLRLEGAVILWLQDVVLNALVGGFQSSPQAWTQPSLQAESQVS
jgi:hypothetical protein